MDPVFNLWLQLIFRWVHVIAGVAWIGLLYFFNWVNGPFVKTMDGPTKKTVVPQLMPRALYFFRWGAAWTWFSGILLAGLVYYHARNVFVDQSSGNPWLWLAILLIVLAVGFVVYNFVMKGVKNVIVANTIVLILFCGVYALFEYAGHFNGRALYIHAGMILGTTMALNVWMIIWPYQKRIIAATRDGVAPDPNDVATAGLRSRHNTYMSIPLIFTMISNHYSNAYGNRYHDLILALFIAAGFICARLLYGKSGKVQGF